MEFNVNQKNVINTIDGDLLVSASAGSGKTTVLVQRIINLILNHNVSVNQLLVITFTNAAALEMKERIIKSLKDVINNENKDKLEYQMLLINSCNIQTFHSFCLDVLKNNYYKLNLGRNLKIVKEAQRKILINDVLEDTFLYYYENQDNDFLNLVNIYGGRYSDNELKNHVISIYNFFQNIVDLDDYKNKSLSLYDFKENEDIFDTCFGDKLRDECIYNLEIFLDKIKEYSYGMDDQDKIYKTIREDILIIEGFISELKSSYVKSYDYIYNIKFSRLSKIGEHEDYKILRDSFKKYIDSLKKKIFIVDEFILKRESCDLKRVIYKLFEIVQEFSNRFNKIKFSRNLIDFNDMEHLTIKLLEDESIINYYKDKFKYIFIDEYQDTNYVQDYIVNKIKNGNNVFMVGDVKQSIYRFRGAKVDLFYDKYKRFNKLEDSLNKHETSNKILLYDNYRSRCEVVDFINYVFENIMVRDVSNILYTEEEYLTCKASYETNKSNDKNRSGEVSLSIILNEDLLDEDTLNKDEKECFLIIDYINKLVNDKNFNYEIYDKKINDYRKIEYRDIIILMRNVNTSEKSSLLQEKLKESEIPVYFDGGEKFFDCIEVEVVLSLLKIINNPLDDIDILTILLSEIYNFNYDDLTYIRIVDPKDYVFNNINKILTIDREGDKVFLNDEFFIDKQIFNPLYDKCKNFIDKIEEYRKKSLYMRIDDFIWFLYEDSGYYFISSTMDEGIRRQGNLRLIFNKAKEFRLSNFTGLFNFIEYLKNSKKYEEDIFVPKELSENENVVRIMSIHKSKGLEFPVVILFNTSGEINFKELTSSIILNDEFGIGLNHIDYDLNLENEMPQRYLIKNIVKKNIISEELRILYVALTRAKEKLFITGTYNSTEKFEKLKDISNCKSHLDFICHSLYKYRDGFLFKEESLNSDLYEKFGFKINLYKDYEVKFEEPKNDKNEIDLESILLNRDGRCDYIKEILNFDYKYKDLVNLPLNLSVSEILSYDDENNVFDLNFKSPKFLDENNKKVYTSIDIGNLYHSFMQNLKLQKDMNYDYLNSELQQMLLNGIIDDEDIKYIDLNKILEFFNNDIGKRVIKSFINDNDNIHREFEFLIKHNVDKVTNICDIRIQGIIDLFFIEDDKIILIDYKTGRSINKKYKEVPNKYKEQLFYYKIALEKIFNKNVIEKYIYSFDLGEFFMI